MKFLQIQLGILLKHYLKLLLMKYNKFKLKEKMKN